MLRFSELKAIVPGWEQITAKIEASDEAKKVLDWIREMYAWDVALALSGVKMDIQAQGNTSLIAQPPHDLYLGNASLTHYTWGVIYHENGKEIWKFDKRFYTDPKHALRVPQFPMPPEWREGIKLQDGLPVGRDLHAMVVAMVGQMNRASASLRDLSSRMGSRQ